MTSDKIDKQIDNLETKLDTAVAERVNGILKEEFYLDEEFEDFYEAQKHVEESVIIYNNQRPHLSCSMLTPVQMHQQNKIELKKWNKKASLKDERLAK